jgi:hypothetical protein
VPYQLPHGLYTVCAWVQLQEVQHSNTLGTVTCRTSHVASSDDSTTPAQPSCRQGHTAGTDEDAPAAADVNVAGTVAYAQLVTFNLALLLHNVASTVAQATAGDDSAPLTCCLLGVPCAAFAACCQLKSHAMHGLLLLTSSSTYVLLICVGLILQMQRAP